MAGLPWIPFATHFPTGEHAIALRVALQEEFAWARVVRLWCWVAEHRADGLIEGPAAVAMIESAAGWSGTPGAFVEALCLPHIGLLDHTSSGFYVHNWHLHCGAHIKKRQEDRARHRVKGSKKLPRKLRGSSVEDTRRPRGVSAQEKETEKDKDTEATTHTLGRENGEADRAAIDARNDNPPHPLLDALVMALRSEGIKPLYPQNGKRSAVEAAIAHATLPVATQRVLAAWHPGKPWLTYYLDTIAPPPPEVKRRPVVLPAADPWEPAPGPPPDEFRPLFPSKP